MDNREATFKGKILDYRPGLISKIAPIVFDPVKGAYEGAEVKINNDGTFTTQIKVPATTPVALRIFGKMISSYVVPGEESSIIINTRELCRQQSKFHKDDKPYGEAVYFGGALAGLSQESFKCNLNPSVMDNYRQLFRDIAGMDAQAYKDFIYGKRATILESIQKASISQALKTVLINQVDAGTAQAISLTEMAIKQAYAMEHKMKNEEVREYFKTTQIKLPENYYEKFYFTPGDLGFTPIKTSIGTLGVLVCWDQWYPEAARLMALQGADMLIYPTAIGWESSDTPQEQKRQQDAWIISQRGHAVANGLPVVAVNRVGHEPDPSGQTNGIQFWGHSFVCGPQGEILAAAPDDSEWCEVVEIDLTRSENVRRWWPFLRDRRIDSYNDILRRFID